MIESTSPESFTDIEEYNEFGCLTFSGDVLLKSLPEDAYKKLQKTIKLREPLDPTIANAVASSMKDWAMSFGCTHWCHWFQPLTGSTAEKHDAFLEPDSEGQAMNTFSGDSLIRGEPDASSFPSGGLRDTWEARGYTAWDPTSPAFITYTNSNATLCIPTVFVSYTGDALDKKTPLLRSVEAISKQSMRLLKLYNLDKDVSRVGTTVGCEQEFFLIDQDLYEERPDLVICGRTLLGSPSPKGHQLDDHYFATIPDRVLEYLHDVEARLRELGIPIQTRHNEVAPGQYEIAPLYEQANIAVDHQMLLMQILKKTAPEHGFACLLHEKPFVGINGSGKHNNWAVVTDNGYNLLNPTDEPHKNLPFLTMLISVLKGLDSHADILRASIASAGNDHRLGSNEAPPAIISAYLGAQLSDVLDQLESGDPLNSISSGNLALGARELPEIRQHSGDRNRTSPFAFTGNKFEFRALGSRGTAAWPNTVLNAIVAESLDEVLSELEEKTKGKSGNEFDLAIKSCLQKHVIAHRRIVFDGDNYHPSWQVEAEKRGLPNLKTTPDSIAALETKKAKDLFEHFSILNKRELNARIEVLYEIYTTTTEIEARTMLEMIMTGILPASRRHQGELAKIIIDSEKAGYPSSSGKDALKECVELIDDLTNYTNELKNILNNKLSDCSKNNANWCKDTLIPNMKECRKYADLLESIVPFDLWPYPNATEMLHLR